MDVLTKIKGFGRHISTPKKKGQMRLESVDLRRKKRNPQGFEKRGSKSAETSLLWAKFRGHF